MDKEYLLNENPGKALFVFAIPMIIGNLFQQFYTMADSIVVGRFVGETSLAAVGASYALTMVFIAIAIGGGIGASVITARHFGARRYPQMIRSIRTAIITFIAIGILLAIFGAWKTQEMLLFLNTPFDVLDQAAEYLQVYFIGLPFLFLYNVLSSMFTALGNSKTPLYLLIFFSVLNILLDIYAVVELNMGVAGVAWATVIAQGLAAILSSVLFLRQIREYEIPERVFFDQRELKEMTRVALPSILQQSTVMIGMMLVQSVVNRFGSEVLAGYSAAMRTDGIFVVPMVAIGNAMSSYTAQNIGARQVQRVVDGYHAGAKIVAGFAFSACVLLVGFRYPLIRSFLGDNASTVSIQTGTSILGFMGWFFVLIGLKMLTDGLLRGAGHMFLFTAANLVNLSIRVGVAMICAPRFGVEFIWYAVPLGWFANLTISFASYWLGRWKASANLSHGDEGRA